MRYAYLQSVLSLLATSYGQLNVSSIMAAATNYVYQMAPKA